MTRISILFATALSTDRTSLGYNAQLSEWNMTLAGASHTVGARCFD